jgi:tRNA nucleotidyltransferase (CCA-adding enzyme)
MEALGTPQALDTRRLAAAVPEPVLRICQTLAEHGHRAWVVGGCVRDLLLDALRDAPADTGFRGDWDIATDALPEGVQKLFRRVIPTGIKHGTVTVLMGRDGFEVTTLRGETTYSDGRRPDSVYFVDDIAADLARRDFTINAIAWDPLAKQLIDPFGGVDDLVAGRLRAVGDAAARFAEDGLRVLRAARFVATLEVELEPATASAIRPSLASYAKVSAERIREEWVKAMKAKRPSRAFEVMREHGLLDHTAPELLEQVGCQQNKHHAYDVWVHTLAVVDACPPNPVLRMAALLHDISKPETRAHSDKTNDFTFYDHEVVGARRAEAVLTRLRFSNEERARIVALVRHHLVRYDESWSDATVRRWLKRVGPELVPDLLELSRADLLGKGRDVTEDLRRMDELAAHVDRVVAQGAALTTRDLAIDGHALMQELGLKPGPVLGMLLKQLLDEVVENPDQNTREALLERARVLAAQSV